MGGGRKAAAARDKAMKAAYDELMAQGWIEILPKKGAFVVDVLPEITPARAPGQKPWGYPKETSFQIQRADLVELLALKSQESRNLVLDGGFPDITAQRHRTLSRFDAIGIRLP